jgi:hypothetical protein
MGQKWPAYAYLTWDRLKLHHTPLPCSLQCRLINVQWSRHSRYGNNVACDAHSTTTWQTLQKNVPTLKHYTIHFQISIRIITTHRPWEFTVRNWLSSKPTHARNGKNRTTRLTIWDDGANSPRLSYQMTRNGLGKIIYWSICSVRWSIVGEALCSIMNITSRAPMNGPMHASTHVVLPLGLCPPPTRHPFINLHFPN